MNGRVQAIFEDVIDLPHEQRTAYLDRACDKDDALRSEVESLLRAHEEAGAFLISPTAGATMLLQSASPGDANSPTIASGRRRVAVPENVGPVRLVREIGRGGMGCVWLGRHELLQRDVAVKFVLNITASADSKAVELFLEGARAAAAVKHPGLTAVHHADVTEDVPYLVMDYIDGGSLSDVIKRHGPLSVQQVAAIVHVSCDVLAALHDSEIVHRDIKPSNILIGHDGHLSLTDFGLACERVPQGRSVRVKGLMGTPQYMAPEMFDGVISPRTDIYALGVTAYELLTGNTPFSSESEIKREGNARELPRAELEARGVPEGFIDLIERMANPAAMFRLKSARQVQQLLKRAADAPTTQYGTLLTGLLSQARSTAIQDGKIERDADSSSTNLTVLADRKRKSSAARHAELEQKPDGVPIAAHSTPGDRSTDALNVEEKVVPTSIPCLQCEYDLKGSPLGGVCPECGTAMSENLSPARIIFAPREWLQSMQQGFRGIGWAFIGLLGITIAFITVPLIIGGLEWIAARSATVTIDRAAPPFSTLITLMQTLGFLLTTALVAFLLISTWKATRPAEHDRTTVAMRLFRAVRPIAAAVTALWAVALVFFLWSVSTGLPPGSMTPFTVVFVLAFAGTLLWMLFLTPRMYLIGRELHLTLRELFHPAQSFKTQGAVRWLALFGTYAVIAAPLGMATSLSHMRLLELYPWIEGTPVEFGIRTLAILVFIGLIAMCYPFVELPLATARRLERALANHDQAMAAHKAHLRATNHADSSSRPTSALTGSAVPTSVPCISCGYDLKGLPAGSRCSECATPLTHSLRSDRLLLAPALVLRRIALGARLVYWGIAGLVLFWILLPLLVWLEIVLGLEGAFAGGSVSYGSQHPGGPFSLIGNSLVYIGALLTIFSGIWLLTTPHEDKRRSACWHRLARIGATASVVGGLAGWTIWIVLNLDMIAWPEDLAWQSVLTATNSMADESAYICIVIALFLLVGMWAEIPRPHMKRWTALLGWALTLSVLFGGFFVNPLLRSVAYLEQYTDFVETAMLTFQPLMVVVGIIGLIYLAAAITAFVAKFAGCFFFYGFRKDLLCRIDHAEPLRQFLRLHTTEG